MSDISPQNISNISTLLRWVHSELYQDGILNTKVFENQDGGMSTDWAKHSTPQETRDRVKKFKPKRNPNEHGVISLNVGKVRAIDGQKVEHTPKTSNFAHTDVFGEKTLKARIQFSRISSWAIEPPKE